MVTLIGIDKDIFKFSRVQSKYFFLNFFVNRPQTFVIACNMRSGFWAAFIEILNCEEDEACEVAKDITITTAF